MTSISAGSAGPHQPYLHWDAEEKSWFRGGRELWNALSPFTSKAQTRAQSSHHKGSFRHHNQRVWPPQGACDLSKPRILKPKPAPVTLGHTHTHTHKNPIVLKGQETAGMFSPLPPSKPRSEQGSVHRELATPVSLGTISPYQPPFCSVGAQKTSCGLGKFFVFSFLFYN